MKAWLRGLSGSPEASSLVFAQRPKPESECRVHLLEGKFIKVQSQLVNLENVMICFRQSNEVSGEGSGLCRARGGSSSFLNSKEFLRACLNLAVLFSLVEITDRKHWGQPK
jgi:hypothetical protein